MAGVVNHVADALSRYVGGIDSEDPDLRADVSTTHDTALDASIRAAQREDDFCQQLIYYLQSGDPNALPKLPVALPEFDLMDDLLVRRTSKQGTNRDVTQVVVSQVLVPEILYRLHSSPHAGHPGKTRTLLHTRILYYWPLLCLDIIAYIVKCRSCAENYGSVCRPVPIRSYPNPTAPWDTVAIDLLKLPMTAEGHTYLLVTIDHFSRFCVLSPIKN